ncbi:MAG: hypothetical protein KBS83_01975 [Lachnospiraceae bacterium]|nr:hypothetical protein [Candidatus Equihabitans merdae]
MERLKSLGIFLGTLVIGVGLVSTILSGRSEYSIGGFIGGLALGLFVLFAAILFFIKLVIPAWKDDKTTFKKDMRDMVLPDQQGASDADDADARISQFRESYRDFFGAAGVTENSKLQSTATQLYWHMMLLQKRRMNRKHISLDFQAERKSYDSRSVTKKKYFDGKYEITDVSERISANRKYSLGQKIVYKKKDSELANYSILNSKQSGDKDEYTCPNCGSQSSLSNLLDGCDFCGTKFTIDDLRMRVGSFALRHDYGVAYDKYKDQRAYYGMRAILAGAIPGFILSMIGMISAVMDMDIDIAMAIITCLMGAAFCAAALGFFTWCGFWLFVFPFLQVRQSVAYMTKKKLAEIASKDSANERILRNIRRVDDLFSMVYFFNSIQNKLAAIHFADNMAEISAFVACDLRGLQEKYSNVIDMDVLSFELKHFETVKDLNRIVLDAELSLITAVGDKCSEVRENVRLSLIKASDCKTESVCEPMLLTCRSCGASLSLLNGGKCDYCGNSLDLKQYDWVIQEYTVI